MSYEYTGVVKVLRSVQEFSATFKKRELVLSSEEERFPQSITFEFVNEKTALLDNVHEGERVTVTFDLRGNESKTQPGRFFNSLRAWKLAKADGAAAGADSAPTPVPVEPVDVGIDDMPF